MSYRQRMPVQLVGSGTIDLRSISSCVEPRLPPRPRAGSGVGLLRSVGRHSNLKARKVSDERRLCGGDGLPSHRSGVNSTLLARRDLYGACVVD
jgi:hypothetical protein